MRRASHPTITIVVMAVASVAASCSPLGPQSDPSRFYVLGWAVSEDERAAETLDDVVVGVGPFQLAPYLDRPQIVTRVASNEVTISEIDRWAEPLDEGIQGMVIQNLLVMLQPQRVSPHPWTSVDAPDYAIDYTINRFERNSDGSAQLSAVWSLRFPKAGGHRGELRESSIIEPVGSASTQELVRSLSRALARLSYEFAEAVRVANAESERH